jgi:hypothetical protein
VITNGSAVLGLGNIGALAGKPVMEGKGWASDDGLSTMGVRGQPTKWGDIPALGPDQEAPTARTSAL